MRNPAFCYQVQFFRFFSTHLGRGGLRDSDCGGRVSFDVLGSLLGADERCFGGEISSGTSSSIGISPSSCRHPRDSITKHKRIGQLLKPHLVRDGSVSIENVIVVIIVVPCCLNIARGRPQETCMLDRQFLSEFIGFRLGTTPLCNRLALKMFRTNTISSQEKRRCCAFSEEMTTCED